MTLMVNEIAAAESLVGLPGIALHRLVPASDANQIPRRVEAHPTPLSAVAAPARLRLPARYCCVSGASILDYRSYRAIAIAIWQAACLGAFLDAALKLQQRRLSHLVTDA